MSWLEHFPRFNRRGVRNKNVLGEKCTGAVVDPVQKSPG